MSSPPALPFIHLRVRSAYSLAQGAIKIKEKAGAPRPDLIGLTKAANMPAVAVTDTINLFGALEFAQAASAAGIQPIIGAAVPLLRATTPKPNQPAADELVLLAQNEQGYRHLCWLVSQCYLAEGRTTPAITIDELAAHQAGLLCLSGNHAGPLGALLLAGQTTEARALAAQLAEIFSGRFYLELQRHPDSPQYPLQHAIEPAFFELADQLNLPLVATNDVHFGTPDQYNAHDALLCVAEKTYVSVAERKRLSPDYCFKDSAAMAALFADVPEAIHNTAIIAQRCAYMPRTVAPILPPFPTQAGRSTNDELIAEAKAGLARRLAQVPPAASEADYAARLDFECQTIIRMGFAGYFLIVADFIRWAKSQNIPVGPGRGSGAGSVVAWALQITDLDPLRFGLLFERFLNPDRISMPDFDVDFCQERRDEVIAYVQNRYGHDRVAQIITFGKLQARAVLRDVGRVQGLPYGQVDKISKLVPFNPANPMTLGEAIEAEPQLQAMQASDPQVAALLDTALQLEGLYRNASTHAAGVVIGDRPLTELVPLYREAGGSMPATQFNMKMVEQAGLVKFDFLGLKTLDVLQQTVELLQAREISLDLATLPLDDAKTYQLLSAGDTTGVFQLESAGMRDCLRQLRPQTFTDIIALVALYRPGPMDNIPKYIAVRHGREPADYPHPMLQSLLEETAGIMIYQEQVMQAAQRLAGYSLGQADLLRRAMGKKDVAEMAAQRANFVAGAIANGVDAAEASKIFDTIDKFAGYGFNKSHAAAYALIAYQTAYLKANYPVEFFTAAMNFELGDTDKLAIYRAELSRHQITLLPPCINNSFPLFMPEPQADGMRAIRYALAAIKGVGKSAMEQLVAVRGQQPFTDLADLAARLDARTMNKKQYESLAGAGAFTALNSNRAAVLASYELFQQQMQAKNQNIGQNSLFGGEALPALQWPNPPRAAPLDELQQEFAALGFYLSAHPLASYRLLLEKLAVVPAAQAAQAVAGKASTRLKLAGVVMVKQERTAKSGNRFAFVQLSDVGGSYEVTLFAEQLAAARDMLTVGQLVLLEVDVQVGTAQPNNPSPGESSKPENNRPETRLIARSVVPLAQAAAKMALGLRVELTNANALPALQKMIQHWPTGRGRLQLVVAHEGHEVAIDLPQLYTLGPAERNALAQLPGLTDVQEV